MDIDISNINLVLIFAGVMAGAIVLYFWNFWKNPGQQINTIASIVTVIGVLGTFVGIAIGLYYFDTSNIEESVPKLLDGLKVAFATSILGIFLSIGLKCYALYRIKKKPALAGKTVDDLAGLLREILDVEEKGGNDARATLHAIERSLTGDGGSTVLTQLQEVSGKQDALIGSLKEEGYKTRDTLSGKQDDLISSFNKMAENDTKAFDELKALGYETKDSLHAIERSLTREGDSTVLTQLQEVSDKQGELISSFDKFAERMAKDNTNALIKALAGVIKDFNDKIKEQFGDNFKELNEAVGKINEWQEQYRQQMDELAKQFQVAAESLEKSRKSLEVITELSNAIPSVAAKLDPILGTVEDKMPHLW